MTEDTLKPIAEKVAEEIRAHCKEVEKSKKEQENKRKIRKKHIPASTAADVGPSSSSGPSTLTSRGTEPPRLSSKITGNRKVIKESTINYVNDTFDEEEEEEEDNDSPVADGGQQDDQEEPIEEARDPEWNANEYDDEYDEFEYESEID